MKLHVQKSAQGPVLAKASDDGNSQVGIVNVDGQNMAGGSYTFPDGNGTISGGVTYKNGGTVGAQYQNSITCC